MKLTTVQRLELKVAAGFGDAWKVQVFIGNLTGWVNGTAYNYGLGKPHYPVPALADTETVMMLDWYKAMVPVPAWDGIWRDMSKSKLRWYLWT